MGFNERFFKNVPDFNLSDKVKVTQGDEEEHFSKMFKHSELKEHLKTLFMAFMCNLRYMTRSDS